MSLVKRNITTLTNFKRGANNINKIIRETTLIWQRGGPQPSTFGYYLNNNEIILNDVITDDGYTVNLNNFKFKNI
jgi:hypothetical protein